MDEDETWNRYYVVTREGQRFLTADIRYPGFRSTIFDPDPGPLASWHMLEGNGKWYVAGLEQPWLGYVRFSDLFDASDRPLGDYTFLGEFTCWDDAIDEYEHSNATL
jgi:hypothetical protein